MRRVKKKIFLGASGALLAVLSCVRICHPEVMNQQPEIAVEEEPDEADLEAETGLPSPPAEELVPANAADMPRDAKDFHPVRGVYSYAQCFPDAQEVQIVAAKRLGVPPVANRKQAENMKDRLVYVGANPYYDIDPLMNKSIPYLVPRASELLQCIARNYLDSLYVKGVPLHKILVSSVLRTEEDVRKLRRGNGNAHEQSCHRFGTTFDIAYNRYVTVQDPEGPRRRTVQNDTLKWVLSEVLRDIREEGRCYVKHEIRQGCFHITVR